jgi:hypothetical protein
MAPISLIMDQEQYYYEVEIVCLDIRFGVAGEWGATVLLLLQRRIVYLSKQFLLHNNIVPDP